MPPPKNLSACKYTNFNSPGAICNTGDNGYCIMADQPLSIVTEHGIIGRSYMIADHVPNKAIADWICSALNAARSTWKEG